MRLWSLFLLQNFANMRKILWMVGLFLNSFTFGQVSEGFSDGEVLYHPVWVGDTARFRVNQAKQLQSTTINRSDTAHLSTINKNILNTTWEFYTQLNIDPSSSNQIRIYLASDNVNPDSSSNSYFIQIGETGASDSYDLYKKSGKTIQKLIDGPPRARLKADTLKVWFMAIHRVDGYWELLSRTDTLSNWQMEGSCFDRFMLKCNFFSISIKHTSTRSDKFIVDDIHVYLHEHDTSAPEYVEMEVHDDSIISILFSEELDTTQLFRTNQYALNQNIQPKKVLINSQNTQLLDIIFKNSIPNGRVTIKIPIISDLLGNRTDSPQQFQINYTGIPDNNTYDIIFSELMIDPSPNVNLPEIEYIELYNSTQTPINIFQWEFVNGNTNIKLPNYTIPNNQFIILCKQSDTSLLKAYGNVIGLSTWPALTNTAGNLKLINHRKKIIDEVNYNSSWYKNDSKAQGGFSLEIVTDQKQCGGFYQYEVTNNNNGGTPGSRNSLWGKGNNNEFYVQHIEFLNDSSIYIKFSQCPDTSVSKLHQNYWLKNINAYPIRHQFINERYDELILTYGVKFKNKKNYQINLLNLVTCHGFSLDEKLFNKIFITNDDTSLLKINELYVDAYPSNGLPEIEYIELYNTTSNAVDLSGYTIVISTGKFILPKISLRGHEYIIICSSNDSIIMKTYGKCIGLNSFPNLSNTSSTITLYNKAGRLIDRVSYKNSWYRDSNKSVGGWSLELIDPYHNCSSTNRWIASSNNVGGTPGKVNSVAVFNQHLFNLSVKYFQNINNTSLKIRFNKPINGELINPAQFYLVGPKMKLFFPSQVIVDSPYYENVSLSFPTKLNVGFYRLVCQDIPSCRRLDTTVYYSFYVTDEGKDPSDEISITEIMIDPTPSRGLPDAEYVELYNASSIDLFETYIYLTNHKDTIPIKINFWSKKSYILLCEQMKRILFKDNINAYGVVNFISIANEYGKISILNSRKESIDSVSYSTSIFPKEKAEGGYSLCRMNNISCAGNIAWQASSDSLGGSPGIENTYIDINSIYPLKLLSISFQPNHKAALLSFNQSSENLVMLSISDEKGTPLKANLLSEENIIVHLREEVQEGAFQYLTLHLENCLGQQLDTSIFIYNNHVPKEGELLINEILFNPYPNSADFIELYNHSKYTIDLKNIRLFDGKTKLILADIWKSTDEGRYLKPQEFIVFSTNKEDIIANYYVQHKDKIIELSTMPSLTDLSGKISIENSEGTSVDYFEYNSKYHLSWLENLEGRSLERIRYEEATNQSSNWGSATDAVGKASPTYKNSQYTDSLVTKSKTFWLSADVLLFSRSAADQKIELNYNGIMESSILNVKLYNLSGMFISEIVHGKIIKNEGLITWDLSVDAKLIDPNTYVFVIETRTESGKVQSYRIPFVFDY